LHVVVAIVGFRNSGDIVRCLAALEQSTYKDFEVVICENGGSDSFEKLTATLNTELAGGQKITFIKAASNSGYAGGINICLRATPSADAWWVLNPDTEPTPNALRNLVARLKEGDADAVGNTLLFGDGMVQSHGGIWQGWFARGVSIGHGETARKTAGRAEIEKKQSYLNGASMIVNRRFVERVGLMREDYFLYCEEVEWCLRAGRRGIRLGFAEDTPVLHRQGTTTGYGRNVASRSASSIYLAHRNSMLLTRDCFRARFPIVIVSAFLLVLLRYGRAGGWGQMKYAYSGWLAGLRGERGRPKWMAP
jgi:hypothetical protein